MRGRGRRSSAKQRWRGGESRLTEAMLEDALLYAIADTGYCAPRDLPAAAAQMVAGGADVIQLRAKDLAADEIAALGRALLALTRPAGVPLIINDHPEIAALIGADGVHVGQDDRAVAEARAVVGSGAIIGKSTHSLAQAAAGAAEDVAYIGFGPLFATPTKPDYAPIGTGDIAEAHRLIAKPIFCIGGIKRENLADVIACGAQRAVIVSGILQAADVAAYCRECRAMLAERRG